MGYITENSNAPSPEYPVGLVTQRGDHIDYDNLVVPGSYKWQNGYRSGPLGEAERQSVEFLDQTGTRADIADQIEALDRLARATTSSPRSRQSIADVHYRDYEQFNRGNSPINFVGHYRYGGAQNDKDWTCHGGFGITGLQNFLIPSDQELSAIAGPMLRSIRPTRPDFNLTRFVGELKDANQLFNLTRLPSSGAGYAAAPGSAYIGYQFGVAPTISDVQKGAEAVLQGDKLVRQFASDSMQLVRRTSTRVLEQDFSRDTSGSPIFGSGSMSVGAISCLVDVGVHNSAIGKPIFIGNMTKSLELRVAGLFEYYVGDPGQFTSRMDYYKDRAEKTLGRGLDVPTLYELTPWSWLGDWFYDIGGLLAYQQDVADYALAMRRASVVCESVTRAEVHLVDRQRSGRVWTTGASGSATAERRLQRRIPGSPYSASPNWSLNGFQWAILGALGMTKAPGIAARLQ